MKNVRKNLDTTDATAVLFAGPFLVTVAAAVFFEGARGAQSMGGHRCWLFQVLCWWRVRVWVLYIRQFSSCLLRQDYSQHGKFWRAYLHLQIPQKPTIVYTGLGSVAILSVPLLSVWQTPGQPLRRCLMLRHCADRRNCRDLHDQISGNDTGRGCGTRYVYDDRVVRPDWLNRFWANPRFFDHFRCNRDYWLWASTGFTANTKPAPKRFKAAVRPLDEMLEWSGTGSTNARLQHQR